MPWPAAPASPRSNGSPATTAGCCQQVARNGRRLRRRLEALAARYPHLIAEVRGRGYMLGIRFGVDRDLWPESLLGMAAEQGFFTPIFASYLLNVEGVRVAPTLNGNSVIRIEPPLTFRRRHCEQLLGALERALEAFSRGETGRILKAILEGEPQPPSPSMEAPEAAAPVEPAEGETRFAFLLHPLDVPNYVDFDPSLAVLGHEDLARVTRDFSTLIDPFVLSRARVTSKTGQTIYGEFITLPWTAAQMAEMPRQEAAAGVRAALELARSRGAQLVGLGAFTSVVTRGGLDVSREGVAGHHRQLVHGRLRRAGGRHGHEGPRDWGSGPTSAPRSSAAPARSAGRWPSCSPRTSAASS